MSSLLHLPPAGAKELLEGGTSHPLSVVYFFRSRLNMGGEIRGRKGDGEARISVL
jgi:hypothetical protein